MRTCAFIICLSSILAVTAGCDLFGPPPSLSHSAVTSGCGPADGPTLVILLAHEPIASAPPSTPYAGVEIWQPVTSAAPTGTWTVGPNGAASAWYVLWPGASQWATSGSITITSVVSAGALEGVVDLQFPSRSVKTTFSALPVPNRSPVLCN